MIKIVKQLDARENTLLILSSPVPNILFHTLLIDGKEYEPVIVYDMPNAIGVPGDGDFEGKEIKFIKKRR